MTPAEWIEELKGVDTPTLSNAIELLGVRPHAEGFAPLGIRCLFPEMGRLAGYAVTAQVMTMNDFGESKIQGFLDLYHLVEASPKPAVIVLQEIGGHRDYAAHCGEVMATFFTRLGAAGLVSDCGVRDIAEVRRLGFHYFARGTVASHANFKVIRSGLPVQIEGMAVRPGGIVHGDENGLITVPDADPDALRRAVRTIREREKDLMDFVRSDGFSLERFKELAGKAQP